jgi:APA family basic amino acid/polyamine antiporter
LSARVLGVLTAGKLLALAAVVVAGFAAESGSLAHFEPFLERRDTPVPLAEGVALALVGVFFSFGGFWEASRIAGDVRRPGRTMPAALAIGVAGVTAAYAAIASAFIYLVPVEEATDAAAFARRAGEAMFGQAGPAVLAWTVVLSVLASVLALLIMAPRLYVAMHRDGLFPSALAAVHPATRAPARATALLALLSSAFVLAGTFQQIAAFFMCTSLVFVALAAAALIVVRRRSPAAAPFASPAYPAAPALFILLVVAVVVLVAVNQPLQAAAGFALVLLGLPVHRLAGAAALARADSARGRGAAPIDR